MATTQTNSYLAVGVDGSAASLAALDWAADEAARHQWPLRMVHAYGEAAPVHRMVSTVPIGREAAEAMFSDARERLAAHGHADLEVSTVATEGSPRGVLLHSDLGAHTLVVGRRGAGQFAELLLGSTALACAAHARVPVVVVPETWQPAARTEQVITLGVDGSARSDAAIEYAFVTASRRQARIVAVFALQRPTPVLAAAATADPEAHAEAAHMLSEQLAPWRAKFPDVAVREIVADGHPVAVLKEYSEDADLVVVGGRGHGVVTGLLLGSVAQAVLTHVNRPVAVVHEPKGA
jgi:nucleotide-binding universal stress UspA family protein